jgi:hypothetical protein
MMNVGAGSLSQYIADIFSGRREINMTRASLDAPRETGPPDVTTMDEMITEEAGQHAETRGGDHQFLMPEQAIRHFRLIETTLEIQSVATLQGTFLPAIRHEARRA